MRTFALLAVLIGLSCCSFAVENELLSMAWNTQPPPLLNNDTYVPDDGDACLRWGNSFTLLVTPLSNDSFNLFDSLKLAENVGNSTFYTMSFTSVPNGAFIFDPPSVRFNLFTTDDGALDAGGVTSTGGFWYFQPYEYTRIKVTAVGQASMRESVIGPDYWNYNGSSAIKVPTGPVEINATVTCTQGVTSCGAAEDVVLNFGSRVFVYVDPRKLQLLSSNYVKQNNIFNSLMQDLCF